MRDAKVSLPRINTLHPSVRAEVVAAIDKIEAECFPGGRIAVRVVQALRTIEYQNELYAQGRNGDKRPKVTDAKGGSSYHNYGLAIDFALMYDKDGNGSFEELSWDTVKDYDADKKKDWDEVVGIFQAIGWTWGGGWNDKPHVEKRAKGGVKELLARYKNKQFLEGSTYVRL